MLLHDPLADGETDARPSEIAFSCLVDAIKPFENLRLVLASDSDPRVGDANERRGAPAFQENLYASRRRRVFRGVVQQNRQQPLQGIAISENSNFVPGNSASEGEISRGHQLAPLFGDL